MNFWSFLFKKNKEIQENTDISKAKKKAWGGGITSIIQMALAGYNNKYTEPYAQSAWIYGSVKKIADYISALPFEIGRLDNKKIFQPYPPTKDVHKLFEKPNPFDNGTYFWQGNLTYLKLSGETFWVCERSNITQLPKAMYVVNPVNMEPLVNEKDPTMVVAWKYTKGNQTIKLKPDQVVHIKYFNPYNSIRGISPIRAISAKLEQDYYSDQFNTNFFKNGGKIAGFIKVPETLNDEQFNRLKKEFNQQHQGYSNAHKVGILESGAEYQEAKISQKDMDFVNLKKMTREEIFTIFGTNAVIMGLYDDIKSFDGIKAARKIFWEDTLRNEMKLLMKIITQDFLRPINKAYTCRWDISDVEALKEDWHIRVTSAEKLAGIGYPLNEINRVLKLGFADMKWGDVWYGRMNTVPVLDNYERLKAKDSINPENDTRTPPEDVSTPDDTDKDPQDPNNPEGENVNKSMDNINQRILDLTKKAVEQIEDETDIKYQKDFLKLHGDIEKDIKKKFQRFLFEQRKRVLKNLYEYKTEGKSFEGMKIKGIIDIIFKKKEETKLFLKRLLKPFDKAVKYTLSKFLDKYKVGDTTVTAKELETISSTRIKFSSNEIINTISSEIEGKLSETAITAENIDLIAEKIKKQYNILNNRAKIIARTETTALVNNVIYTRNSKIQNAKHKWLTAGDEKVRVKHNSVNGKVVKVGDYFYDSMRFPGDLNGSAEDNINCRCTVRLV